MSKTYIIAEAGVNHNGSLALAMQLIEAACAAGADAVKFQSFHATDLLTANAPKAAYQKRTTGEQSSQYEMIQQLELDEVAHVQLANYAKQCDIQFLSTPFDVASVDLLVNHLDVPILKMASGEITNAALLLKAAQTQKPMVISTGMSSLGDIEQALGVIAFGYLAHDEHVPCVSAFQQAYASVEGQAALQEKVILLHCTTEYPAPAESIHLRVLDTLKASFGLPVGYSDHSLGINIPIAAVARGAVLIEKHLTLDTRLAGPDHLASLEPAAFKQMVTAIREVEMALGQAVKAPNLCEWKNRDIARRSLVAALPIKQGEVFTTANLMAKRPGQGISALYYWDWIGKTAQRDYVRDELLA